MTINRKSIEDIYSAFNERDIESVLAMMAEDVKWANGMEGGFIDGRDNVREYWRRQFALIDPRLEILDIAQDADGKTLVKIHQTVKDLEGNLLLEKTIRHVFTFTDGQITLFEIDE